MTPDRTEEFLRLALQGQEPPRPRATMVAEIVNRVQAHRDRGLARRRALLGSYWLAAALGSAWILWRLPWPQWARHTFADGWTWLVPVLCAAALLLSFTHEGKRS